LHTPKISRKFAGQLKVSLSSYGQDKIRTGYPPVWFNWFSYFAASFFKLLGIHFSWQVIERYPGS